MQKLEQVLIIFSDNDFYYTWQSVLNTLGTAIQKGFTCDKEQLLSTLNEMAFSHYLLFQHKFRDTENQDYLKEYLTVKGVENIFINEEVDEHIQIPKYNNYESHYLIIFKDGFQVGSL